MCSYFSFSVLKNHFVSYCYDMSWVMILALHKNYYTTPKSFLVKKKHPKKLSVTKVNFVM